MSDYLESLAITQLLEGNVDTTGLDMINPNVFMFQRGTLEWVLNYIAKHNRPPSVQLVKRRFPDWSAVDGDDDYSEVMNALGESAHRNWLEEDLAQTIDILYEEGPTTAANYISGKLLDYGRQIPDVVNLTDTRVRYRDYKHRRDRRKSGKGLGIPTGFPSLDRWTKGGLQPGNYYIVFADTNVGKTWFCLTLAVEAWSNGYTPLYVSLEGTGEEPGYRFDSLVGHLSNSDLFQGFVEMDEYEGYLEGLNDNPFWLAVQGPRAEYTPGALWTQVAAKRPDLIIVDYLTLMTMEGEDAEDWRVASRVSRTLATGFANRLNIPVVAAAQGTKGTHGKSSLELDDIAIAYAIVRPADMVIGLSPIQGGLKGELLKGRHTEMTDQNNRRPKFYVATDWDVGEVEEDDSVLV